MENNNKEIGLGANKLKWWYLVVASWGLRFVGQSRPLLTILADLMFFIGIGWGLLLLVRYLFRKIVVKK